MTVPRTSFDVPADNQLVLSDGTISPAWVLWFDRIGKAIEQLRASVDAMDDLDPATSTLAQTVTAWEELRSNLQEIV